MLRFVRFNSISSLKNKIISGEVPINKALIQKSIANDDLHDLKGVLTSNKSLLTPPLKNELADFISSDFSLYYLLKDHQWTVEQLAKLIKSNPGRVDSDWDLFVRHGSPNDVKVVNAMIEKLVVDEEWGKILKLWDNVDKSSELVVFDKLVEHPQYLPYFKFSKELLVQRISSLEGLAFLNVLNKVYEDVDLETLAKGLQLSFTGVEKKPVSGDILGEISGIKIEEPDIIEFIESNKLDVNNQKPESLLLRIELIKHYGLKTNDFAKLLEKYHQYQIHTDFGVEIIQSLVIQSYCLKAFKEENIEIFPLIDALMVENIPIPLIQSLILAHSQFDTDKSLDIYNKYISQVQTKPGPSGRSSAGLLNEAIILSFLYNNDRDFANIIMDKVYGSNLLEETEVAYLKRLFKVYGDAYEEDDWNKAKLILRLYIETYIRNL